jgi:hypothetical protein
MPRIVRMSVIRAPEVPSPPRLIAYVSSRQPRDVPEIRQAPTANHSSQESRAR